MSEARPGDRPALPPDLEADPRARTLVAPAGGPEAPTAGVDEAGRGPLAGPVVAGAVILDPERPLTGLADSKKLSARRRETLYGSILERAAAAAVGWAGPAEIDAVNILQATFRAMERAVGALGLSPARTLVDGNRTPSGLSGAECVVGGDATVEAIAAASILAKVVRDGWMGDYDTLYPGYGLGGHKGYGTAAHREALARWGPSPIHRRSFKVVRESEQ